jgi:hypothetical protein
MDLLKYVIAGVGCLILGVIIALIAKNIFAGLGFAVLSFSLYVLWNFFKSAKQETPPPTVPTSSENKDN